LEINSLINQHQQKALFTAKLKKRTVPVRRRDPPQKTKAVSTSETTSETTPPPLPKQPSERAAGEGWSICKPSEIADWGVVGCDSGSCFLYVYSQNRKHANEEDGQKSLSQAISSAVSSAESCGQANFRMEAKWKTLAEELRGAVGVVC
jgi:hypothetical protein